MHVHVHVRVHVHVHVHVHEHVHAHVHVHGYQCSYKYLINSASIGYANKFKYLLLCGSVVLYVQEGMQHKEFYEYGLIPGKPLIGVGAQSKYV